MTDRAPAIRRLDHVAIRVADRARVTAELVERFDVEVIDSTDVFTLIGPSFTSGKITLLDANPEKQKSTPGWFLGAVLHEPELEQGTQVVTLPSGLVVHLVSTSLLGAHAGDILRHSLVGVVLHTDDDADDVASRLADLVGTGPATSEVAVVTTGAERSDGWVHVTSAGEVGPVELDHVGVLVDRAGAWRDFASGSGQSVVDWVEASHSKALFVRSEDGVVVEFIEHLDAGPA